LKGLNGHDKCLRDNNEIFFNHHDIYVNYTNFVDYSATRKLLNIVDKNFA